MDNHQKASNLQRLRQKRRIKRGKENIHYSRPLFLVTWPWFDLMINTDNIIASPPVDSIVLDIPGHSGYVLTTPTEDDAYYMEILLAVHRNTGPKNVKKP